MSTTASPLPITDHELEQVERGNATTATQIVFTPGLPVLLDPVEPAPGFGARRHGVRAPQAQTGRMPNDAGAGVTVFDSPNAGPVGAIVRGTWPGMLDHTQPDPPLEGPDDVSPPR
jgi:hypothetical protein